MLSGMPCAASTTERAETCSKTLYALGALLRGSREAQAEAATQTGKQRAAGEAPVLVGALVELVASPAPGGGALTKALALVADLLAERYCDGESGEVPDMVVMPLSSVFDKEKEEPASAESEVRCNSSPLAAALLQTAPRWCPALHAHLPSTVAVLERQPHAVSKVSPCIARRWFASLLGLFILLTLTRTSCCQTRIPSLLHFATSTKAQKLLRACQAAADLCSPHWDTAFVQAWRAFGFELEAQASEGDEFALELSANSAALAELAARAGKDEL